MPRLPALLRLYSTLLFLVGMSLLAAIAIAQTVRLRYLEARHARMFEEFGNAQLDFQIRAGDLQRRLAACEAAKAASTLP